MENLKDIEKSLHELKHDFNNQLEIIGSSTQDFHNSLILLTSKYPEHQELIQFIVFINDKLETNQSMFSDIIVDSFNQLIDQKEKIVKEMIKSKTTQANTNQNSFSAVLNKAKNLKDVKVLMMYAAIITLAAAAIFAPDAFIKVITAVGKFII